MKKRTLLLGIVTSTVIFLSSCGGGSDEKNEGTDTPPADTVNTEASAGTSVDAYTQLTGQAALTAYESLVRQYGDLVKSGSTAAAETLKKQLDELGPIYQNTLSENEKKALSSLTNLSIQIAAGELENMDQALEEYGKAIDNLDKLSGGELNNTINQASEEFNKSLDASGTKEELNKATKDAGNQINDAMKGLDVELP
ncbi:MAG: hypothetical protein ACKO5C_01780 [Ferruginibacter sp.]